ncbi:MAG TPA: dephospho-CoA kinase [Candidatus Gemmiger excrementipullorum]|uniref:Dephospho-CoA kinase n=1 Tax=Candidatus Gemmiger excrementipullorum TaxID=2838610 RepID=A0A9D2BTW9_9FIRM|nr:dephospho-CoA kinase [Candidatus Gemmiger excrementipullorum]
MKIVGITGRSGCGKSSATKFLAQQGYPCIDADQVAREVMLPGSPCLAQLQEQFGADILDETGALRRRLLADRAFATPEGTRLLTELTQPEILRRIEADLQCAQAAGAELAFVDGAVIVGSPFQARCDELVLITAPYEVSVQRICARDGIAPEMARRRLDAQTPLEQLRAAATVEIANDGTPQQLQTRIRELLQTLRKEEHG